MGTSVLQLEAVLMTVMIIFFIVLLFIFIGCITTSMLLLYIGWLIGPKWRKDNIFCFLSIILGVYFWVFMLSVLYDPAWGSGDLTIYALYTATAGATPLAAFPGVLLFNGKRKT